MNKEHIKQLAKDFCEAERIEGHQYIYVHDDHPHIHEEELLSILPKFLQSMIEEGEVVEAKEFSDLYDFYEKYRALALDKSTVSSAGKEVKTLDECKDIIAVKNGFKDWSEYVYLHPIGRLVMDAVCNLYANQFESSPASTASPAKVVSDNDIFMQAVKLFPLGSENPQNAHDREIWIQGAKSIREQLTGQKS